MDVPESLTVSVPIAKRLKDAGWHQDDTYFFYLEHSQRKDSYSLHPAPLADKYRKTKAPGHSREFAALTGEEILRKLPIVTISGDAIYIERTDTTIDMWNVGYKDVETGETLFEIEDVSFPNAIALLWIYMKENHLLPKSL